MNDIWIRPASRDDAPELAALLTQIGQAATPKTVIARLGRLEATGLDQVLVAERNEEVVGVLGLHLAPASLHSDTPTARMTLLVVANNQPEAARQLLQSAEELAARAGCQMIEGVADEVLYTLFAEQGYASGSVVQRSLV